MNELKVVFLAVLRLLYPDVKVPPEMEQAVGQYVDLMRRTVPPQVTEQLLVAVPRLLSEKGEADLRQWLRTVELTTNRAAFLVCNDLELAARLAQVHTTGHARLEAQEIFTDLVRWCASDGYFALREYLGLAIEVRVAPAPMHPAPAWGRPARSYQQQRR
jgi:hypothetical protein